MADIKMVTGADVSVPDGSKEKLGIVEDGERNDIESSSDTDSLFEDNTVGSIAGQESVDNATVDESSDDSFVELMLPPDEVVFDERNAAFEGLKMVLSGKNLTIAEAHFRKFSLYSAHMSNGYCFVQLMKSILSQDSDDIMITKNLVKDSEKLYKKLRKCKHGNQYSKVYANVCQADAYLFRASLLLIKFDLSVALQIGWYLRKAAKLFRQNEVTLSKTKANLNSDEFKSLNSAVGFGVGFTNLALSILPPSYASVMNVIGFESDRVKGLQNLDVCRRGSDFHSPLAAIVLLWYYLLAKPLMCANAEDLEIGFQVAEEILAQSTHSLPESSWIHSFFKGKLFILRLDVDRGLELYTISKDYCGGDFEKIQVLLVFEIGWCWVIKCDYHKAVEYFSTIKDCSYWSEGLYPYVTALCLGTFGDMKQAMSMIKKVAMIKKKHPNNSEYYVISRSKLAYNIEVNKTQTSHYKLLLLEMLYLWNHLALLSAENRTETIKWISKFDQFDRKLKPVAYLICGALQTIAGQYHSSVETLVTLRTYLAIQKHSFSLERSYGLFELALAKSKLMSKSSAGVDMTEIEDILDKSVQLSGYQFENRLKLRVHSLRADLIATFESSSSHGQSQ
ncbi:tetratricopeptide repeat protein 39C-like [Convolutriloba macropyga]|uniref:tetratricopeptide repeat protein 39C-like n=1 Tax=Convolutriloba macropyga TaxID=536237 RepID=UPI003F520E0D